MEQIATYTFLIIITDGGLLGIISLIVMFMDKNSPGGRIPHP
jgi:hypothetical protein